MQDEAKKLRKAIPPAALGYILVFDVPPKVDKLELIVAKAVLEVLSAMGFSGRCEYYARDPGHSAAQHDYVVGLGLRNERLTTMPSEWWLSFRHLVHAKFQFGAVRLVRDFCEYAQLAAIRQDNLPKGTIIMREGACIETLPGTPNYGPIDSTSPFWSAVNEIFPQS